MTLAETRVGTVARRTATELTIRLDTVACQRCLEGRGCGAGILAARARPRTLTVPLPGSAFDEGDRVVLTLAGRAWRRAALFTYVLPIVALLAGGGLASIWLGDVAAALVALSAFALALAAGAARTRSIAAAVVVAACPG